ncbi:hypothetical protein ABIE18_000141 [Arthrobacter sp. 2762]
MWANRVTTIRPGFPQLSFSVPCQRKHVTTELRPGSGDKLADIHQFAEDLKASDNPHEVVIGLSLTLILKGKNR